MAKSRGRKFAEITSPSSGVFDLTSVPTITNAKLQNSAMTLAGSSVSLGGTGVANTDALSEGSSNLYFTDARVQTFLGGGTLAGNIVVPDNRSIYVGSNSDFRIIHNTTNTQLTNITGALQITSSGALALSGSAIAVTGATTFSSTIAATGAITANAGVVVDNITIDGTEIDLSSGDLLIDVAGDIILDADGGDTRLHDAGVLFAKFTQYQNDLYIDATVADKDIIFRGNDSDGSNPVTALRLDMSNAGDATFNRALTTGGNLAVTGQGDFSTLIYVGTNNSAFSENNLLFQASGHAYIDHATTGQDIIFRTSNSSSRDTTAMVIQDDGNVGIGVASPGYPLEVQSGGVGTVFRAGTSFFSVDATGSASSPSLIFNGDNNTGFYRSASDTIKLATGGSDRITVDSSGSVGIGITPPTTNIHTQLFLGAEGVFLGGSSSALDIGTNLYYNSGWKYRSTGPGSLLDFDASGQYRFFTAVSGSANAAVTLEERMRIENDGKVGIGTTTPATLLNTKGATLTATTDKREILIEALSDGSNNSEGALTGITFRNSPTTYTASSFNRTSGIYGVNQDSGNYGRSMGLVFYTSTNDGTAQERMRIRNDGNVGIGNTSPNVPLSVGQNAAGSVANFRGSTYNQVNISHANNSSWGLLLTNSDNTSNSSYHYSPSGENKSCAIVNVSNDALHFGTNNTNRMTIEHGGDVGIGTNQPESKLDVTRGTDTTVYSETGDQRNEANITVRNASETVGTFAGINFYAGAGTGSDWSINNVRTGSYAGDLTFKTRAGGGSTDWRERLRLKNNGDIQLGGDAYRFVDVVYRRSYSLNRVYTHVANIDSSSLGCSYEVYVNGTTSSVVVNAHFHIMVGHYYDISIKSFGNNYTDCKVKVVSNGNEDNSLYIGCATSNNATFTGVVSIRPHGATGVDMTPSGGYNTCYLEHAQTTNASEETTTGSATSGAGPTNAYSV